MIVSHFAGQEVVQIIKKAVKAKRLNLAPQALQQGRMLAPSP